jgi:hypothetical protein
MLFGETAVFYCKNHTDHTYRNSVRTSQETHYISAAKPNKLMLFVVSYVVALHRFFLPDVVSFCVWPNSVKKLLPLSRLSKYLRRVVSPVDGAAGPRARATGTRHRIVLALAARETHLPRWQMHRAYRTCSSKQNAISLTVLICALCSIKVKNKVKLSLCWTNLALRYEGVWGSGCIDPHFLDHGTG